MPAKGLRDTSDKYIRKTFETHRSVSDEELDNLIQERRKKRNEIAKREIIKSFGEAPMLFLLMLFSAIAGSFSSIYVGPYLNVMIENNLPLPWFFISRDFMLGMFASLFAISSFLLITMILILYNYSKRITDEDSKKGHARTRKY